MTPECNNTVDTSQTVPLSIALHWPKRWLGLYKGSKINENVKIYVTLKNKKVKNNSDAEV